MYDHIIVPFDGTPRSLGASLIGADFSRIFDARLLVLTASGADSSSSMAQLKERAMAMSGESIDVWVEAERRPARAVGIAVSYRPKAFVCMATHARTGLKRLMFGSVAEQIIRESDDPVLLLGPECNFRDPADLRQVIVCLDGTPTAESAVPLAGAWANTLGIRCLLLHSRVRGAPGPEPDLDRYQQTLAGICPVEMLHVDTTKAVDGIVEVARHATGSLLVMATHGRTGLDRFRNGSAVVDVVRQSPIPVLVQRGDMSAGLDYLQSEVAPGGE